MPEANPSRVDMRAYLDLVGKDMPQPEQFNYEATRDSIRHFSYAVADYNALYLDEEYARSTRWGGIVAPPGYLYSHGYAAWLSKLPGLRDADGGDMLEEINAGESWEFVRPVRAGDHIYSYGFITRVEAKRGKSIGDFVAITTQMRYTNQRGELVAQGFCDWFRYNSPRIALGGGLGTKYPPLPRGTTTRSVVGPTEFPGTFPTPARRYFDRRCFEDVNVGDPIPAFEVGPLNASHMAKYNAAMMGTGWDHVGAAQEGAVPDSFAPGCMRISWFAAMLVAWAGPDSFVTRMTEKNLEWVLVGFKVVCGGRVTGKRKEGFRCLVDCELWCDSELGFRTNVGSAEVEIPGRGRD